MTQAPFTPEKVAELNKGQKDLTRHPYTCDRHSSECETKKENGGDGVLIATVDGWVCLCGKYKQNWAH